MSTAVLVMYGGHVHMGSGDVEGKLLVMYSPNLLHLASTGQDFKTMP